MIAHSKLAKHSLLSPKAAPASEALPPVTDLEKIASDIENLPDEAAAVAMITTLLGDTTIARFKLGGALVRMKQEGWLCGCHTIEDVARDQFGIGKSAAYYAMLIYLWAMKAGLSAEALRQLGIKKLSILCSQAEQHKWTKAEFSTRVEKAKAIPYRKLEDSFKVSVSPTAPKLPKPAASAPTAAPEASAPASSPTSTMALLKASVQPAADLDIASVDEDDDPAPEPAPVLEINDAQLVEVMRACKLKHTLALLGEAFPGLEMEWNPESVDPELLGEDEAAE